jgi:hypothetical protein
MEKTQYPNGDDEPDQEYNDYTNDNADKACSGDCLACDECPSRDYDFDDAILNSSALAKNTGKDDNKYTYTNDVQNAPKVTDSVTKPTKPKHRSFKETWLDVDEMCTECGAVKVPAKGLTRQNVDRLLSFKGNSTGWVMFFLMCMALFFAYTTWSFIVAPPLNCSNASSLLIDQQTNLNLNQMPALELNDLNVSDLNTSCQNNNPNASDYCTNFAISLETNESA